MAHQGEAKRRDEESAIALGGGSLSTDAAPVEAFDDSRYGSQDFRKTAAPGSWGADRDTSRAAASRGGTTGVVGRLECWNTRSSHEGEARASTGSGLPFNPRVGFAGL
mmetsp:Transcript_31180/g.107745  ORF Transcript_31180/g.107745 Transcript_31180/m.107745 type:complete len:108 (-) Transcript_31180:302-625(-)